MKICYCYLKGLQGKFQTILAKMAMSDSEWYSKKFSLIKHKLDINVFNFIRCFSTKVNCAFLQEENINGLLKFTFKPSKRQYLLHY